MIIQSNIFKSKLVLFLVLLLFTNLNTAYAGPCASNNWQPTFVHDNDSEDGPWFVLPNGRFEKVRIVNNRSWTEHACDLIKQYNVRNKTGYRGCRNYTDIQCGCKRGLSEANSTCANFLAFHNRMYPTSPYMPSQGTPNQGTINLLGETVTSVPNIFPSPTTTQNNTWNSGSNNQQANQHQSGGSGHINTSQNQNIRYDEKNSGPQCLDQNPDPSKYKHRFDTNNNPNDQTYIDCIYGKDRKLKRQQPYTNGKRDGVWLSDIYYQSCGGGFFNDRRIYRNGKKVFTWTYSCDETTGNVYKSNMVAYSNGIPSNSTTWYSNRIKKEYVDYKPNGRVAVSYNYNNTGQLTHCTKYDTQGRPHNHSGNSGKCN